MTYDAIIVGAGFAGLAAARELGQAGLKTRVIEAKDTIGGRAQSAQFAGTQIELGGGYVHWTQPHIFSEITRYGLTLIERPYYAATNSMRKTRFLLDGEVRDGFTPDEARGIAKAFADFVAPAKETFPRPFHPLDTNQAAKYDHLSSADRIAQMDLTPLERATLTRTAAMQCNNTPTEGAYIEALRWFALANAHDETYAASVSRFTLKEGTRHLLNAIANDARTDIMLNTPVTHVETLEDAVQITTARETLTARRAIIATGVNVWKNIDFAPALTEAKAALSRKELSGKGAKIYVELEGRFEDSRWSATEGPILSVLPHEVSDARSVVVLFTNPEHPFDPVSRDTVEKAMQAFDPKARVLSITHHDWVADVFVQGTWGNLRPGQFTNYFAEAQTPEGPLHFATADIAHGWRGFFDGALESGIRAARAILRDVE
ncbi:MAG: NAD(P)/FAD-dependent oxidoreductase [Pseudomonadota bacterium]